MRHRVSQVTQHYPIDLYLTRAAIHITLVACLSGHIQLSEQMSEQLRLLRCSPQVKKSQITKMYSTTGEICIKLFLLELLQEIFSQV